MTYAERIAQEIETLDTDLRGYQEWYPVARKRDWRELAATIARVQENVATMKLRWFRKTGQPYQDA